MKAPVDKLTKRTISWLSKHKCKHSHTYLSHFNCYLQDFPNFKLPKRIGIFSDPHCGHFSGLTPPAYNDIPDETAPERKKEAYKIRKHLWSLYSGQIAELKPFDVVLFNGDCIDGKGKRSGGVEQVTTDRLVQAEMAGMCVQECDAPLNVITYGTPYHTGEGEDFEKTMDTFIKGKTIFKDHAFIDVNGCIIDAKHKIGGSTIPHGRLTALAKEKMWADLWHSVGVNPESHIIVRSHVHYYAKAETSTCTGIVTPALQGLGSNYGARQCSGIVDWGFIWIDIEGPDNFEINSYRPFQANVMQKVDVIQA